MVLDSRIVRNVLDAAEKSGIRAEDLVRSLGADVTQLTAPGQRVPWTTFTALASELSRRLNDDPDELRRFGRRMVQLPSYTWIRGLAQGVVSARDLYQIGEKWMVPVAFPHASFFLRFIGERRMLLHTHIPDSYAPCPSWFHVVTGEIEALPEIIGLPPSRIVECRVGVRSLDLVVDLPPSRSLMRRSARRLGIVLRRQALRTVLEDHGEAVSANLEALQRARDELRSLLERLPDLVVVHAEKRVRWANRAFLEALGYERLEDVVGTANPLVLSADGLLTEVIVPTRRGTELVIEVAPEQEVSFDGVLSCLVVGRDVTEQVRIRKKLMLADRLSSLGLLAAGVAHEVDAPLVRVLGSLEDARRKLAGHGERGRTGEAMLEVALEGVDRMRLIVTDLLVLARGDETPAVPVDVASVVTSTLALAAPEIERVATLVRDFAPVPRVCASEPRIAQVLLNLLSNALEAMRGRETKGELRVRVVGVPGGVLLEVADTGRGISSVDLPHVFEPFFTTNVGGSGTGLGLAIAQRLVVQLGGDIQVAATSSEGTTFHVTLPEAKSDPGG